MGGVGGRGRGRAGVPVPRGPLARPVPGGLFCRAECLTQEDPWGRSAPLSLPILMYLILTTGTVRIAAPRGLHHTVTMSDLRIKLPNKIKI